MTQLDEKWTSTNSRIGTVSPSDNQVAALCKQMITSANDILKCEPGNINLISTGRELGEMGSKLNDLKSADVASPINTFAKNILFTSLYINKQTNGNDSFQASLNSLIDTTDQLMVLLETGLDKSITISYGPRAQLIFINLFLVIKNEGGSVLEDSKSSFMTRTVSDTFTEQSETSQSAFENPESIPNENSSSEDEESDAR